MAESITENFSRYTWYAMHLYPTGHRHELSEYKVDLLVKRYNTEKDIFEYVRHRDCVVLESEYGRPVKWSYVKTGERPIAFMLVCGAEVSYDLPEIQEANDTTLRRKAAELAAAVELLAQEQERRELNLHDPVQEKEADITATTQRGLAGQLAFEEGSSEPPVNFYRETL